MDESVLAEMLGDAGFGAGRSAFGEAGVESHLGAGVGKQEMLHDLLDVPLVGAGARLELGLGGVESIEGECDLELKPLEGGIHRAGSRYTGCWATASVLCGSRYERAGYFNSSSAL